MRFGKRGEKGVTRGREIGQDNNDRIRMKRRKRVGGGIKKNDLLRFIAVKR